MRHLHEGLRPKVLFIIGSPVVFHNDVVERAENADLELWSSGSDYLIGRMHPAVIRQSPFDFQE